MQEPYEKRMDASKKLYFIYIIDDANEGKMKLMEWSGTYQGSISWIEHEGDHQKLYTIVEVIQAIQLQHQGETENK